MTLTCPHCQKPADIPEVVFTNADRYENNPVSRTGCCGRAVKVHRRVTYSLSASNRSEDDWGEPCKAPLPLPPLKSGWLPIKDAPKDGTVVDLWVFNYDNLSEYRLGGCHFLPGTGWMLEDKLINELVLYYHPAPDFPGNLTIDQKKALVAR